MELIDKATVIAEIEKIYDTEYKFLPSDIAEKIKDFKDDLIINLNTIKIKECKDLKNDGICNFALTKLGRTIHCENISCSRK